ncbi:hypothetical protein KKF61_02875 [Patescibacteria group bacterium]|nr:hypothetical protein [Patescibacteria group bacterium]
MPRTKIGKWSAGLIGAFVVFLALFYVIVATGQRGGEGFFDNLYLTISILLAGVCGVASFVAGLIAIIKQRERAVLVYLAVIIGALVTLWIAAEIFFPH